MSDSTLELRAVHDVPLVEVSDLLLRADPDGGLRLWAVGDADPVAVHAPLAPDGTPGEWSTVDLRAYAGATKRTFLQMEAIADAGGGRVLVGVEDPPTVVLADPSAAAVLGTATLSVPSELREAAKAWDADPNSRGEAAVLLADGHLLVAKEKKPPALGEWGPPGSEPLGVRRETLWAGDQPWPLVDGGRLDLVAVWLLAAAPDGAELADLSALACDPDGRLWLLSDKSEALGLLPADLVPGERTVALERVVPLGDRVGGKRVDVSKPEGLAFLPDGSVLVGRDTRKGKDNLLVYEPVG